MLVTSLNKIFFLRSLVYSIFLRLVRRANSSPISSSSSSKFDGIAYYHVTITNDTTTASGVDVTDGNAPGTVVKDEKTISVYEDNTKATTAEVKSIVTGGTVMLDEDGVPYIQVNVHINQNTATYSEGADATATWACVDWGNSFGSDLTNATNFGYVRSNKLNSDDVTKVPTSTDLTQGSDEYGNWNSAFADLTTWNDSHVTVNGEAKTGAGYQTFDEVYLQSTATQTAGSNTSSYWLAIDHFSGTKDSNEVIKTGNLSVPLSSGLVAVLPVSGGAISILYFFMIILVLIHIFMD